MKYWYSGLVMLSAQVTCADSARFFFGYGDEATAQLARSSGIDPLAEVGREIPGDRLAVPTVGGKFKVQLCIEAQLASLPQRYCSNATMNIAFDRTLCSGGSIGVSLNQDSFRKVGEDWLIAHRKVTTEWNSPDSHFVAAKE